MTAIAAARVVTPTGTLSPGVVEVHGEHIVSVGPTTGRVPDRTIVPGFVDLQCNGTAGVDVAAADGDDWTRIDERLVSGGVTTWCPTLTTRPLGDYAPSLGRIAVAQARDGAGPAIAGAHLEGPFLGAMPGAHPAEHIVPPDLDWLRELPPVVRIVTLGAEVPDAAGAIRLVTSRGATAAIGHSAATYEEAEAAADAGATLVTHCFNAMQPLHHRHPGVTGAALSDPRLVVSLIADGVHVHPAVLTIALRAKGRGGAVLVTDAVAGATRRPDGRLAGSDLTMDRAVRNVIEHCGVSLGDAVHAASTAPAALLGLDDRGQIEVGARADLVALDGALHVEGVWIGGVAC